MNLANQRRLVELDALRGIAALAVVFFHFTMGRHQYNYFFKFGTTGVDLFFIISGFVIFMSLQRISKGIEFVINRISRLYPIYWISVTFTFLLTIAFAIYNHNFHLQKYGVEFLSDMTMLQFYFKQPNLDGCYWTMIIEMIFYILILALFQAHLLRYLRVIGVVSCLSIFILTYYFYGLSFTQRMVIEIPLVQFLPLFFAGTIFYEIYPKKGNMVLNYLIIIFCLLCQFALFPCAGMSKGLYHGRDTV